jgi:hypothetical protein
MRILNAGLVALLLTIALPLRAASPPAPVTLDRLTWMLGSWVTAGEAWQTFEHWERVGQDVFRGVGGSRDLPDGSARVMETLHLLHIDGELFYLAKVKENPLPVAFRLTELAGDRAVFENPDHDFPTRLEYMRGGDGAMSVRVSGSDDVSYTLELGRPEASSPPLPAP